MSQKVMQDHFWCKKERTNRKKARNYTYFLRFWKKTNSRLQRRIGKIQCKSSQDVAE